MRLISTFITGPFRTELRCHSLQAVFAMLCLLGGHASVLAADDATPVWNYRPELLRPFWTGDVVEGESVLFVRDEKTGEARASVLFPIQDVLSVRNSVGDVTYENGKDYVWNADSREIVLPAGSRIVSRTPPELRRPAGSQKYALTHRDGNGEIFFGGRLEYAEMQTCITYRHEPGLWKGSLPRFDPQSLRRSVARLTGRQPLSIVTLGDSISAGANASALYAAAPYQPAYPELVRRELAERFGGKVEMKNLAVGGTDTGWGLTQINKVVAAAPHLVILAFGMNDSAGRSPQSYKETTQQMIAAIREKLPECEFVLVASMLGNRDWTTLKHDAFPQYRDALAALVEPGIALADLTSIWTGFVELKKDWDQTGNGVNHPNDFGHRVYAQVITELLGPGRENEAAARVREVVTAAGGEEKLLKLFRFEERLLIKSTLTPLKTDDKPNRTSTVQVGDNWWIGTAKRAKDKVRVLCWSWSLRVLLDPKSKTETLPAAKIGDVAVVGLRVTESIAEPVDLWFDAEKKQLVAIDYTDTRHFFSEWKTTDAGHRYPSHVTGHRFADLAAKTTKDKQWYQTDILSLTPLDALPADLK
jgi:acyl-CoA thioesterase I